MARRPGQGGRTGDEITIKDLLSYRLNRLSSLMSRSAATTYRRQFDLSLGEWRTIALLGVGAQNLNRLARQANLDKAQVSRIVASLVERGYIARMGVATRGRTVELELTPEGRTLYERVIGAARERNAVFLAYLTPEERRVLTSAVDKLTDLAWTLAHDGDPPAQE